MFGLFNKNSAKVINVNDIDNLIGKIDLIDIREPFEYRGGSIKTAKNIPMGQLLLFVNLEVEVKELVAN